MPEFTQQACFSLRKIAKHLLRACTTEKIFGKNNTRHTEESQCHEEQLLKEKNKNKNTGHPEESQNHEEKLLLPTDSSTSTRNTRAREV
jgi:hypothetical protein